MENSQVKSLTSEQILCLAMIGNVTNSWELVIFTNFDEPDGDMLIKVVPEEKTVSVNASKLNFEQVWATLAGEDFATGLLQQGRCRLDAIEETGPEFSKRLAAAKKFMNKFMKTAQIGRKIKFAPPIELQVAVDNLDKSSGNPQPSTEPDPVEPVPQDVVAYFEAVRKAIHDTTGDTSKPIYPSSNLRNDLDLDSLDITELAMALEENFISERNPDSSSIDDDESSRWRTVQDIMDFLHEEFHETQKA